MINPYLFIPFPHTSKENISHIKIQLVCLDPRNVKTALTIGPKFVWQLTRPKGRLKKKIKSEKCDFSNFRHQASMKIHKKRFLQFRRKKWCLKNNIKLLNCYQKKNTQRPGILMSYVKCQMSNVIYRMSYVKFLVCCISKTKKIMFSGNGNFNLILMCWPEGVISPIHDHSDSHCFMRVLEGEVREIRYLFKFSCR